MRETTTRTEPVSTTRTTDPVTAGPVATTPPATRPVDRHQDIEIHTGPSRDRSRWGPVWAGFVVTLATFLLLEVIAFATGLLTLTEGTPGGTTTSVAWVTGAIGVIAFFLGGLTAAASASTRRVDDGLLQGILVWALTVTGVLLITLLGGGALFGAFSQVLGQLQSIQSAVAQGGADVSAAVDAGRSSASIASLALGAFIIAAAIGGLAGAKMTPRQEEDRTIDVR